MLLTLSLEAVRHFKKLIDLFQYEVKEKSCNSRVVGENHFKFRWRLWLSDPFYT